MASTRQTSTRTARSPHTQHRNRERCAGHKAQILDLLKAHSPDAPSLDDLRAISGRLSARIDELRSEGWMIEAPKIDGRVSTYRLVSKVQGPPIVFDAVVSIYVSPTTGGTSRTHERLSGHYSADRLLYAEEQAKRAYLRALGRSEAPAPRVKSIDDDLDLDGGVW
jgi:hypothetical protein